MEISHGEKNLEKVAVETGLAAEDLHKIEPEQFAKETFNALSEHFPIESKNGTLRLEVVSARVDKSGDKGGDLDNISKWRYEAKSYSLPVKVKFRLYKDGNMADEAELSVGKYYPIIPTLKSRLIGGSLYQSKFQVRRKPGVYLYQNTKGKAMAELNTKKGRTFNFTVDTKKNDQDTIDISFPGTGAGAVTKGGYALMRAFGNSDDDIKKRWGEGVWAQNASDDKDLLKTYKKVYDKIKDRFAEPMKTDDLEEASKMIRSRFEELGDIFDPEVNKSTIGVASGSLNKESLTSALTDMVDIHRGNKKPNHRFAEKFRQIHYAPTQIREAINHHTFYVKFVKSLQRNLNLNEDAKNPKIASLTSGARNKLSKKMTQIFTTGQLTNTTETNNIMDIDARANEVTIRGPGGIQSLHSIQGENVTLHPSRLGLFDIVKTQVSAPGVVVPLARGAVLSEDGDLQRVVYDTKEKRKRTVTSSEIDDENLGFADEYNWKNGVPTPKERKVRAAVGDNIVDIDARKVRYVMLDPTHKFSDVTNLTPFLHHNAGSRAIMGVNQMAQALSLKDPDKPLVMSVDENGETFSKKIGTRYNIKAEVEGVVESAGSHQIVIKDKKGKLHKHNLLSDFPLNQGGFLDHQPVVKKGDEVKVGDLLTKNNYTTSTGELAIGKNLLTAYMPYKGWNYEDGIVVSESAAQKLVSEHIHEETVEVEDGVDVFGLRQYGIHQRSKAKDISPQNRNKLDDQGIIKKGETVEPGDILVALIRPVRMQADPTIRDQVRKMLKKSTLPTHKDKSLWWHHGFSGKVVNVVKTPTKISIFVKTEEPFKVGDKLSAIHGNKGIVSKILPDSTMPHTQDGRVIDMLIDPHGVPSRTNPGQLLELAAGKIADKTGQPYLVKNYEEGTLQRVKDDLKKNGLSDKEDLIDGETGKTIKGVATGILHMGKLKHQLDKKFGTRQMFVDGYDRDMQPLKGATIDSLTLHALIGHDARANLNEITNLKGTENTDYWATLAAGRVPPRVKQSPYSFRKMQAMMESLGLNINKSANDEIELMPMTDKEVERRSAGEITESRVYRSGSAGFDALKSGLYDKNKTGSDFKNWNHVQFSESVPNPLFAKAITGILSNGVTDEENKMSVVNKDGKKKRIGSISKKDIEDIFVGDTKIIVERKEGDEEELVGGEGIKKALAMINLSTTQKDLTKKIKAEMSKKRVNSDRLNDMHTTLRYAKNLQHKGIKPEEGFMMSKFPIMPAEFRLPSMIGDDIQFPDVSNLYRTLITASNSVKSDVKMGLDRTVDAHKERLRNLYNSFGALVGADGKRPTEDYSAKPIISQLVGGKKLKGEQEFGGGDGSSGGPKNSFIQTKVIKKRTELSGRTTIVPDPGLDIDEVRLPEEMAWRLYEPFIRNRISKLPGQNPAKAHDHFRNRSPLAKMNLESEMKTRPVMINRDPAWWQYNIMGVKPILAKSVKGEDATKELGVPNLIVNSFFGGDFDGDNLNVYVPVSDEAVREARQMFPSKHLMAHATKQLLVKPTHSMLIGMNMLSGWDVPTKVKSVPDAIKAYDEEKIELSEVVSQNGKRTTAGWEILDKEVKSASNGKYGVDKILQEMGTDRQKYFFTKKDMGPFLKALMESHNEDYAPIVSALGRAGNEYATKEGFSVGISDVEVLDKDVKKVIAEQEKSVPILAKWIAERRGQKVDKDIEDEARISLYTSKNPVEIGKGKKIVSALNKLEDMIVDRGKNAKNTLLRMMNVGSAGNKTQIRQIMSAPLMVNDASQNTIPIPILNGYGHGLKSSEYYIQQQGAVSGLRDRSVKTSEPGDIGKQIISSTSTMVITENDCGTKKGETLPLMINGQINEDILDRITTSGEEVTLQYANTLKKKNKKSVKVRSPLHCESANGVCQKCFGFNPNGQLPKIGENIGVQQGQALTQVLSNQTLKSFHKSGAAEEAVGSLDRMREIINLQRPSWKAIIVGDEDLPKDAKFTLKEIKTEKTHRGNIRKLVFNSMGNSVVIKIPPGKRLKDNVTIGATFEQGDPLTDGNVDPKEIRPLKGFRAMRDTMVNQLNDVAKSMAGMTRRTSEVVIKSMTQFGRIFDPGDSDNTPGQFRTISEMKKFNNNLVDTVDIDDTEGMTLEETLHVAGKTFTMGSKITSEDIEWIRKHNGDDFRVKAKKNPIKFEREVFSVDRLPEVGDDWLSKLNFRRLKFGILRGGIEGHKADLHGTNPIAPFMAGTIGRRNDGKY